MEYRQLGTSGLRVSTIALGTMTFGGRGGFARVGSTEVDEAKRIVDQALDAGVNLIDTADIYSTGRSEEIVGETLKGRRDNVVLATKARFGLGNGPNDGGLSIKDSRSRSTPTPSATDQLDNIGSCSPHDRDRRDAGIGSSAKEDHD